MTTAVLLLALAGTTPGWFLRDRSLAHLLGAALGSVCLAGLGVRLLFVPAETINSDEVALATVLLAFLAVLGGGTVTAAVLRLADEAENGSVDAARKILRGGAWIGAMERAAIFGSLAAGWPEGVAVVLALKGLGRFSELSQHQNVAERFLIGSFASVLWAAGCAAVLAGLGGGFR